MQPGAYDVPLQLAPMLCWRCGQLVKAVRGYLTHRAFVSLAEVSDTRTLSAFVIELGKRDPKVSPSGPLPLFGPSSKRVNSPSRGAASRANGR